MNLLELAQRAKRESGRTGSAPVSLASASTADRQFFDWVADAWLQVQTDEREWLWMRSHIDAPLTPTVGTYAGTDLGATDFGRFRKSSRDYTVRVYNNSDPSQLWRCKFLPLDMFRQRYADVDVTDAPPQHWTLDESNQLLLGPAPDLAYFVKCDYYIEPTVLDADADEPGMPSRFHILLVWRAVAECALFDAAPELLARARANYEAAYSRLIGDQTEAIRFDLTPLA